jgi:hypothetical protein
MEVVTCDPDNPDALYGRSTFKGEDTSRDWMREARQPLFYLIPPFFLDNAFTNKTKSNTVALRKLPARLPPAALASSSV